MLVWALVSWLSDQTVEVYFNEQAAQAALRECLVDEPGWVDLLAVLPLDLGQLAAGSSFSPN